MSEFIILIILLTNLLTALITWYFVTRKKEKECDEKLDNIIEIFTMKNGDIDGYDKFRTKKITFRRKHGKSS